MSKRQTARRSAARQPSPPSPRGRRPTWRYWVAMVCLAIIYQALFITVLHRSLLLAVGGLVFMAIVVVMLDRALNLGRFFFK